MQMVPVLAGCTQLISLLVWSSPDQSLCLIRATNGFQSCCKTSRTHVESPVVLYHSFSLTSGRRKQDLADIATSPELLNALTHAPSTIHPSLSSSHKALQTALTDNLELASRLIELETRLAHQRSATQAQLLSTHALERQWRQKQSDMDHALAPFSPTSMYQRLGQGVHEQASVCHVLEESFIEGEGDGAYASERETLDWIKRYRDAKVLYNLRQERKERWDEGRVGGWR